MLHFLRRLRSDRTGATAIEHSLIIAAVAVAIISALAEFGGSVNGVFTSVSSDLQRVAECTSNLAPEVGTGSGDGNGNCANTGNGGGNTGGSGTGTGNGGQGTGNGGGNSP
jgi:Flp pilus assembly pilin Flp